MRHEFLKGAISAEPMADAHFCSADVIEALGDGADDVTLHVSSPGGDAMDAVLIDAAIRVWRAEHPDRTVAVEFDGYSVSATSYAFLGADVVRGHPSSVFMIHDPSLLTYGNAAQLRKDAEALDRVGAAIARAYVRKTGRDPEEVAAAMAAETWMDAEEALAWGLIDGIADEDTPPQTFDAATRRAANLWPAEVCDRLGVEPDTEALGIRSEVEGRMRAFEALEAAAENASGGEGRTIADDVPDGAEAEGEAPEAPRAEAARSRRFMGRLYLIDR